MAKEEKSTPVTLEQIVSLAKRRGFIFPGSEIYGGLAGTFDYGPLGLALKKNIEALWWRMFVDTRDDMYGIDAAILMNPKAWESSGHVSGFADPLVECRECKSRYRIDHLITDPEKLEKITTDFKEIFINFFKSEDIAELESMSDSIVLNRFTSFLADRGFPSREVDYISKFFSTKYRELLGSQDIDIDVDHRTGQIISAGSSLKENLESFLSSQKEFSNIAVFHYLMNMQKCPNCGKHSWSFPRQFNMMFSTKAGASEDDSATVYLRPETAGGMFVNFKNIIDSFHPKLPFGMAQIGKAFRNEIAPREFLFRVRELEQMEIEYFVSEKDWETAFEEWRSGMHAYADALGLPTTHVHELNVEAKDLAHYSKRTIDFEFDYPFGRRELWGLAYRTDFDLRAHETGSGQKLEYLDETTGDKITPHVIEPSFGVGRTLLAVLSSAYREDELGEEKRVYLALNPKVAPIKAMVAPLLKNKPELVEKAKKVRRELQKVHPAIAWDDNGNIGKRYRRQDEIGTPFCITVDFDTLGETPELKDTVTLRHRDTGEQERLSITEAAERIRAAIS